MAVLGESNIQWSLDQAQNLLDPEKGGGLPKASYPEWYGGSLQGPATQTTADYVANNPYQTTVGLMGGDYNRLEQALQAPIYQQYGDALKQLNNAVGGSGLYGSVGAGMHDQSLNDLNARTGSALSQATAQRYGLQMEDTQNTRADQQFAWKAGLTDASRQQDYNQAAADRTYQNQQNQINFANQQLADNFNYQLNQNAYNRGLVQDDLAAYLSLGGMAAPAYSTASNNAYSYYASDIAQQNAQEAADAFSLAGWLGAGGSLIGGLLGSDGFWSLFGD